MPVRPFGSAAGIGLPQLPQLPRFRPVASSAGELIRLLSPSPLPSGNFSSLGIKAFNGRRRRPVRLPIPPDFQPCSPRACNRSEHCVPKRCAPCRSAPRKLFSPVSASSRSSAPQLSLRKRNRSLVTAFPSPATASAFTDSIPGSMVPACSFALSLPSSRARSAFLLHRLNRLAPIPAVSLLQARCASTDQLLRLLSLSPLPSGSFCSLGIKAFNRRCSRPVRLLNSPDLCSLPANLSIASMALGSSFAVRYVSTH